MRWRIWGHWNAFNSGSGKARPLVSITMPSRRSWCCSTNSIVGRKSSCTVQQRQPLASSTTGAGCPSSSQAPQDLNSEPSIPTSPNSFTNTAKRRPLWRSNWRNRVVLPAPRKPVTTVTGRRFDLKAELPLSMVRAPSLSRRNWPLRPSGFLPVASAWQGHRSGPRDAPAERRRAAADPGPRPNQ